MDGRSNPTHISVSVVDDTIADWVTRLQDAVADFVASPAGGGFITPTQWFEETEVAGADRAVRPVGFPSDDGIATTLLAEVGDSLVIVDSYNFHDGDPEAFAGPIEEFLSSVVIRDPGIVGA